MSGLDGIRTRDTRLKSPVLYQTELRVLDLNQTRQFKKVFKIGEVF